MTDSTEAAPAVAERHPLQERMLELRDAAEMVIHQTQIGEAFLAHPTREVDLNESQTAIMGHVALLAWMGRWGAVEHWLRLVERDLWPSWFDPREELKRRRLATAGAAERSAAPGRSDFEAQIRDPDIVAFIQAEAIKVADLEEEIAQLEASASRKALRRAKLLKVEVRAARRRIEHARDVEVRRDALMGEARDPLIRAKHRGELVAVQEVETAEIARDEHGARIINRRGSGRGLPALVYSRHNRARLLGGIQHAHAQGYLDNPRSGRGGDALLQVGEQYEQAVADANPLKAVDPEASGGGSGPRGPQMKAIQASEWLKIARRGLSARELRVLDLICGEGHHAARAARLAGFGFQATLRALRGGLATAAANHLAAIANGHQPVARQLLLGELLTR